MPIQLAVLPFVFVSLAAAPEGRTLESILQSEGRVEITESGMTVVDAPHLHVLVARISREGSLETGCLVTHEAVEAFLQQPAPQPQSNSQEK